MNQKKIGVVLSYLSQGIYMLSSILYTPIMLRILGPGEYGLYQLVYATVSYLGILSFGFTNSYVRFWARYKIKEDETEIARLNGIFLTIFLVITGICVLCGIFMVGNIEFIFAEGITTQEYELTRKLLILLILNLAMTFPNSVFDAIISSREQFIFQKAVATVSNVLNPFLTLPLLLLGYGSVGMVLMTTILTLSKLLLNIWFCVSKLKVKFLFCGFQLGLLKEMWIFTFFIFLNMIVDQINWNVDKFLLGRYAGTTAVAVYSVGAQINSIYRHLATTISSVFIPQVNRIVAESNDNKKLTQLLTRVGRMQFLLLILVLTGFIFLGVPFIRIWAGEEYAASYLVAILLMVPVTIPLIQSVGIEIQRAKNMHKARSLVYFFIAIANVCISIPCIYYWGVYGAAFGTAIALVVGNGFFMNWYYHKKIELDMIYYWRQIRKVMPAMIIPVITGIIIKMFVSIHNIFELCGAGVIYVAAYSISMWLIGLNSTEKHLIKTTFEKVYYKIVKR